MAKINEKKANTDYIYDLETHKMTQLVKKEEYAVKLLEKEHSIALEEKEIQRKEKEPVAKVKKPAKVEQFRLEAETKGMAEAKRIQGEVESETIRLKGAAEADAMMNKSRSWQNINQTSVLEMILKILQGQVREISEPLSKVDKIVMVNSGESSGMGASKITGEIASIMAQLSSVVQNLSGIGLKKLVQDIPQKKTAKKSTTDPDNKISKHNKTLILKAL